MARPQTQNTPSGEIKFNRSIIQQAQLGDKAAIEQMAKLLKSRAYVTAARYASLTGLDRDDLEQEFWVGVFNGLRQVNLEIGDPVFYLYTRGRWSLLENIRRLKKEAGLPLNSATLREREATTTDLLAELIAADQLTELFGSIGPIRHAILKQLLLGHTQESVCQALGCTAANIAYHVKWIRQKAVELGIGQ